MRFCDTIHIQLMHLIAIASDLLQSSIPKYTEGNNARLQKREYLLKISADLGNWVRKSSLRHLQEQQDDLGVPQELLQFHSYMLKAKLETASAGSARKGPAFVKKMR